MSGKVFLSYRRGDSQAAGRLKDRLVEAFGEENVFFDVDSIAFGEDFREVIGRQLSLVDVTLVVIGDDWDFERLASPRDYVRLEVSEALRQDKHIIPVLVDAVDMPDETQLPEEMRPLVYRTAAPLRPDPDFHTDASRLIESLQETVPRLGAPTAATEASAPDGAGGRPDLLSRFAAHDRTVIAAVAGGVAVLVILIAVIVLSLSSGGDEGRDSVETADTDAAAEPGVENQTTASADEAAVDDPVEARSTTNTAEARGLFQAWMSTHEPGQCPGNVAGLDPSTSYPLLDEELLSSVFFELDGSALEETGREAVGWIGDTMIEEGVRVFMFVPVPAGADRGMDSVNFELRSIAILDELLRQEVPLDWACPVLATGSGRLGDQVSFYFVNDPDLEGAF